MFTSSWARAAALTAAALCFPGSTGCGIFTIIRGDQSPGGRQTEAGRVASTSCQGIETREEIEGVGWGVPSGEMLDVGGKHIGQPPGPDEDRPTQLRRLACAELLNGSDLAAHHYQLDPVHIDPLDVAVTVASCGRSPRCLGAVNPDDPALSERYTAGLLAWYTAKVAPEDVEAAVASVDVAPPVAGVLVNDYTTTRAHIMTIAGAMQGTEKEVLLDVPFDVRDRYVADAGAAAEQLGRLATLAAQASTERSDGVGDETILALEDLRRAHLKACGDKACMADLVGRSIARELFFAHISRADPLGAGAELDWLPEGNSADEIAEQQAALIRKHRDAATAVERSIRNGVDRETAVGAAGGVEPHAFEDARPLKYDKLRPNYRNMVPYPPGRAKISMKTYRLKSKKVAGDRTTLVFFDDVKTWDDEICRDTNRIDRIDNGRIVYKQRCRKTGKKASHRTTFDPVEVPTHEAQALRAKDYVSLHVMTGAPRTGRVAWAKLDPKKPAVQVRGIRLK